MVFRPDPRPEPVPRGRGRQGRGASGRGYEPVLPDRGHEPAMHDEDVTSRFALEAKLHARRASKPFVASSKTAARSPPFEELPPPPPQPAAAAEDTAAKQAAAPAKRVSSVAVKLLQGHAEPAEDAAAATADADPSESALHKALDDAYAAALTAARLAALRYDFPLPNPHAKQSREYIQGVAALGYNFDSEHREQKLLTLAAEYRQLGANEWVQQEASRKGKRSADKHESPRPSKRLAIDQAMAQTVAADVAKHVTERVAKERTGQPKVGCCLIFLHALHAACTCTFVAD